MTGRSVVVDFPAPTAVVYAYLSSPRNRPAWQASLRRVEQVSGTGAAGTTWYDVTAVGVRPRMQVTEARPPHLWAETGVWRGIAADLRLDLTALPSGTRVVAMFEVRTPRLLAPLGTLLQLLAVPGVRSDLRRAARAVGS